MYNECINVILLECDNSHSLGMSCQRDLFNIYNEINKYQFIQKRFFVLTNTPKYFTDRKINQECVFKCTHQNLFRVMEECTKSKFLYIHISGHGYQTCDRTNNELDGRSEYIILQSGMLCDYEIYSALKKYIDVNCKIRLTVDTCHSGTMSNFNYAIDSLGKKSSAVKKLSPHFENAYSLSACSDNQYSSNDIGYICGFGGSLTVHMIDTNTLHTFLFEKNEHIYKCLGQIEHILVKLKQKPLLLTDK